MLGEKGTVRAGTGSSALDPLPTAIAKSLELLWGGSAGLCKRCPSVWEAAGTASRKGKSRTRLAGGTFCRSLVPG